MPYIIGPRSARSVAAAVFASALLSGAVPAMASAACPSGPTSKQFAQFGDEASYTLVQGGSFEAGAPGWELNKAVVTGGEASSSGDTHALAIHPGGRAVSPGFCVSSEYPSFRFLLRQVRGGGKLSVGLRWTNGSGQVQETTVAALEGSSSWAPSPVLLLASSLPLSEASEGTLTPVQLVFRPTHPGLEDAIDSVYLDPYRR
jgi:hypothetical protein